LRSCDSTSAVSSVRHPHLRLSTIHFHITQKCSLRCRHCSVEATPHSHLPPMDRTTVKRVLMQGKDMGAGELEITGGDPLTLDIDYLDGVIRYASSIGLSTSIFTNAQRLGPRTAPRLEQAGVRRIVISLYGRSSSVHDAFTGTPGSHARTLEGIRSVKKAGMQVIVATVVTGHTLEDVLKLADLLHRYAVDGIQFSAPVPTGRARDMANKYPLREDDMEHAIIKIEHAFQGLNYLFLNSLLPDPDFRNGRYCNYFVERLAVDPSGEILPCCLLPAELRTSLGNVHRNSIQQICCAENIVNAPVFYWLSRGHGSMRKALKYRKRSHNLCRLCIDMLHKLVFEAGEKATLPDISGGYEY